MSQPNLKKKSAPATQFIVVCEPNKPPTARPTASSPEFIHEEVNEIVGGPIEQLPYPRQLGTKGLVVAVSEQGIARGLEQNRWGLVGTFVVYRQQANRRLPQGLESETANAVVDDLDHSYGYLDPKSGVQLACSNGIGFCSSRAMPADKFERRGGKWNPQLHFTGPVERHEMTFMNWLIQRHARGVVAYYLYEPLQGMYSLELQFGPTEEDRKLMLECRRLHHEAFDKEGNLKQERADHPPEVTEPK